MESWLRSQRQAGAQQHWYLPLCTDRLRVPSTWRHLETLGQALRVKYSLVLRGV